MNGEWIFHGKIQIFILVENPGFTRFFPTLESISEWGIKTFPIANARIKVANSGKSHIQDQKIVEK